MLSNSLCSSSFWKTTAPDFLSLFDLWFHLIFYLQKHKPAQEREVPHVKIIYWWGFCKKAVLSGHKPHIVSPSFTLVFLLHYQEQYFFFFIVSHTWVNYYFGNRFVVSDTDLSFHKVRLPWWHSWPDQWPNGQEFKQIQNEWIYEI